MKEVKSFVIDRSEWLPAEMQKDPMTSVGAISGLLMPNGRMCCLGVYLSACGIKKKDLLGRGYPGDVKVPVPAWLLNEFKATSNEARRLAAINDDAGMSGDSLKERERQIVEHFAAQGIKVTFKGRLGKRTKGLKVKKP